MGWFDEQIKERKKLDDEVFSDAFIELAGSILNRRMSGQLSDSSIQVKNSIDEILKYYGVKSREIPDSVTGLDEQLEFLLRPHGIMRRNVRLEKGWYKDAVGAMLVRMRPKAAETAEADTGNGETVGEGENAEAGTIVAMIPGRLQGYSYIDPETGKKTGINHGNEDMFERDAIAFYKPFPMKKLGISDLVGYMLGVISPADIILYAAAMLVVTLVGMLVPKINHLLFSNVVLSKNTGLLMVVAVFFVCVTVSKLIFSSVKALFESRINTKLNISVEAATMMRVLNLPAGFFKKYSSGNMSSRVAQVRQLCSLLVSSILSTGLTSVFSLLYISQLFKYASTLVAPALVIILITTVFTAVSTILRMKLARQQMLLQAEESGMSYAMISGVQKIKLSGSEKRLFARWARLYSKVAKLQYNPPLFLKINSVISTGITLVGTIVLYYRAASTGVSSADYIGFTAAYGYMTTAFTGLVSIAQSIAQIKPVYEMASPILETLPEMSEGKEMLTRLSGNIELNNVSFRYDENSPNIVDNMSLKIKAGQYVAIVGKTGCGKSTLVRLLLGFEKAQKGAIYYDSREIGSIDRSHSGAESVWLCRRASFSRATYTPTSSFRLPG